MPVYDAYIESFDQHSFKSIAKSPFSRRKEGESTICRLHEKFLYTILVSPHKLSVRVNTKRIRRVGMIGQCPSSSIPKSANEGSARLSLSVLLRNYSFHLSRSPPFRSGPVVTY